MAAADEPPLGWGRFILAAYGPTTLSSIGFGAIIPLVVLSARELDASVGMAALISALLGIGQLVGDLPAGWIAARVGEKRAIIGACLWDACSLLGAHFASNLVALSIAVFCCGLAGSVFGLARQTYITESVPLHMRARALSTLGGVFRIGFFLGPLAGAWVVTHHGLQAAYVFAAAMSLAAAAVTMTLPDLPSDVRTRRTHDLGLWQVLRQHLRVLVTLGTGALVIQLVRSARQAMLPLWADSIGMSAAATSLVFSLSMALEMALFFFGGLLMDRMGRIWVVLPSLAIMGAALIGLVWVTSPAGMIAVAVALGIGNGISSGVVMTLGSDASPDEGRTQFLAGWRLMSDTGNSLGPLVISGIALLSSLGVATVSIGLIAWLGAGWLRHTVPRTVRPVGDV